MSNVNFTYVPEHIADSDELSLAAKKILEALLDYLDNSQASTTRKIFINNKTLCRLAQVGHSVMFKSLKELKQYSLVDRIQGKDMGTASEYIIHFDKLEEPLRKKTFNEFFAKDIEMAKSRETPIGTTITTSITTPTSTSTSMSTSTSTSITTSTSTSTSIESPTITEKPIENTNTTLIESPIVNETKTTNSNDKVEQMVETDEKEELFQFFVSTVNSDVERLFDSFFSHFKYGIESNTELGKELIDYVFDKLGKTEYELYRRVSEQIETVFKLEKPKYLVNTNTSTPSKKVDEEDLVLVNEEFNIRIPRCIDEITEIVQDEMPF